MGFGLRFLIRFVVLIFAVSAAMIGSAADVHTISNGERVELTAHLAAGKLTLFDFHADWCGPCKALAPKLDRLVQTHPDRLALRKIDVTRSGSPVGEQYRIQSIPHLKLFGEDGRLVSEGNAHVVLRDLEARLGGSTGHSPSQRPNRSTDSSPLMPIFILGMVAAAIAFFFIKKPSAGTADRRPSRAAYSPNPDRGRPGASWFVMLQGSLEGPFSETDLEDMLRRKVVGQSAKIRRRGDREWKALNDVVQN
ncbi:MAG: GYF domain-containing protein [Thermoanaerobaculales bacterium]|nr:GYF domain-containing protein [Thermoanaerobaculales bacterium]